MGKSLKKQGVKKALFVTDPGLVKLGIVNGALDSLKAEGVAVQVFDSVKPDPSFQLVLDAGEAAKSFGADHVIGFGGGSSMDVAKVAAVLAEPGCTQELDDMYGVEMVTGSRLPLTLVPTTAGTGSEVTMNSILTTSKPGEEPMKKGIVAPQLLPDTAILDAELTVGLPLTVTADTGVDAMVHAIEAYTTRMKKNVMSDVLAKEALRLLSRNIRTVCLDNPKDIKARSDMLLGSCIAGVAFNNAPVGAVHALAYPLGSHFHITHGLSNSVMLPHVMDFNRGIEYGAALYAELAPHISEKLEKDGVGGVSKGGAADQAAAEALIRELQALLVDLKMKNKLTLMGIEATDVDLLTQEAWKQQRLLPNNVREVAIEDIKAMYTEAL